MFDPALPPDFITRRLKPLGIVSARAMPAGFSGAAVYQCEFSDGVRVALKRWPANTSSARIEEVHRVLQTASVECPLLPKLHRFASSASSRSTFVSESGKHWELAQWMTGEAALADANLDTIKAGAAVIALFHRSTRALGITRQPAPSVIARLQRANQVSKTLSTLTSARSLSPEAPVHLIHSIETGQQLLRVNWNRVQSRITRSLGPWSCQPVDTQYVLRDIHRQHLLFSSACDPSGLIDFDAVRIDTIATDLARWVGSFLLDRDDPEAVWQAGLAGLSGETAFNHYEESRIVDLAKHLHFASLWISLANWVGWVAVENRAFSAGLESVADRIGQLAKMASREI